MLRMDGMALLEITVRSLLTAGISNVVVLTNREDAQREQERMLQRFRGVELLPDDGVRSTIELLQIAERLRVSNSYCFVMATLHATQN